MFSSRTTLWRHKKACADTEITTPPDQMTSELTNTNEELLKSVNKMVASFSDLHNVMVSNANLFGNMIDNVKQLLDENKSND
jgi:Ni,Fe-hydrogenase I large subunit